MADDDKTGSGENPPAKKPGKGKGPVRLQIKAGDEIARGVYANLALIHKNDQEFVLDFVFAEPQRPAGHVVSRVVVNPKTAKRLLKGMQEMVRRFEERFGEIELPDPGAPPGTSYH
jgi:hypothetical protein